MLGDRQSHAGYIRFLKGICANRAACDLPGDRHNRRRIHHRRRQPCNQIGRAGAAGRNRYADLARRPRITIRHMRRALFMAHQHMMNLRILGHRIIRRQNCAAGVAEHHIHPFTQQTFHDYFSAAE